jgi:CHAT domain-containing protein
MQTDFGQLFQTCGRLCHAREEDERAARAKLADVRERRAFTVADAFIQKAPQAELIYLATHGVAGSGKSDDPLRDSYLILSDNRLPAATIKGLW